ncbi:E3 ubiquitin-protein ligase PUB23-like [Impatiens glandulifera]|uniref:E3 ubiquitin-protein ligase PUB23-like n=1 Tax=Impatiens glandulifera TaxID=253017 RepID=UPI001FB131E0|nr:E3 ubiquitin-protein ligase PUB23-like [Impatiens glandulifera]
MSNTEEIEIPHYFICPISLQMMKDPVIVPTGITYDRENIEKWVFSNNNQFCPVTKQPLPAESVHDLITPNHTLRRLIQSWCAINASNGIERFPTPKPAVTKSQITKLINDHSKSTTQAKINCLAKLKSMASVSHANKRCIEAAGGALFAASLITESDDATNEALSTLHSLNLSETGLKTLFKSNGFLNALTCAMKLGSYDSRAYAVMILKSITEVTDPTDMIIGSLNPRFFTEIVQLVKDQITPKATRAGLHVLINVTSIGRNRVKAVEAGAVQVMIDMLVESSEKRVCEMALTVLDHLCQCAEGRAKVLGHGAGLAIVSKKIMRVSKVASERAIRVLHSIAKHSGNGVALKEMLEVGVVSKLCLVLQVEMGTKIKERVIEILKMHARTWKNAHCIPMALLSSYP